MKNCDVVVMLRLQSERMKGSLLPSAGEYFKHYGLTADNAAAFLGVARERLTPPAGNAAVNSTPIANGNTMPAPLAQP